MFLTPASASGSRAASSLLLSCALALAALSPPPATAGAFSVSPMRLELGGTARSAALTVRNEDTAPQSFQVRALAWTQDDEGDDRYEELPDLVYFPRLLVLAPGQEGVIRVGLRQPATQVERAFRLFVEELAPPAAAEPVPAPSQVRLLVRFGAPVFVRPLHHVVKLEADDLSIDSGRVRWRLRNEGNRHERLESLRVHGFDAQGAEVFAASPGLGYLLAGRSRSFELPLPSGACSRLARLALEAKTAASDLRREQAVPAAACP